MNQQIRKACEPTNRKIAFSDQCCEDKKQGNMVEREVGDFFSKMSMRYKYEMMASALEEQPLGLF